MKNKEHQHITWRREPYGELTEGEGYVFNLKMVDNAYCPKCGEKIDEKEN